MNTMTKAQLLPFTGKRVRLTFKGDAIVRTGQLSRVGNTFMMKADDGKMPSVFKVSAIDIISAVEIPKPVNEPLPDHLTLKEARDRVLFDPLFYEVLGYIKLGRCIRLRFMLDGVEAPDTMLVADWRAAGGTIVIDDEGGGLSVAPKTPELV